MPDLTDRFRSLDRVRAPDLWSDITERAVQPGVARDRGWLTASWTYAAAVGVVAVAVLAGVVIGQALVGNTGPGPTLAPTPLPSPSMSLGWDPTYLRWISEDRPGVLVGGEPTSVGTDFFPYDHELRGEWVDGKLCYTVQMRRSDGSIASGSGDCLTWDEFVHPASDGPTRGIGLTELGRGELIYEWAVLSPDVVRVEVTLESGEVAEAELFEMPIGPNGERVRWLWLRTLSPVDRLVPLDADGERVVSGS